MAASRPWAAPADLYSAAAEVWNRLTPEDWLEAFAAHPRIGESKGGAQDEKGRRWSAAEQAGTHGASAGTRTRLAELNRVYDERFGYLFIVCASGKSAEEMLALLEARLDNPPDEELRVAAGEQEKITRLRLEKLLRS